MGAAIGATPITIISSENSLAAAGPSARSRTMARGSTTAAEAPRAARTRNSAKEAGAPGQGATDRSQRIDRQPGQQRRPPADPVGHRALRHLPDRQAGEVRRQRVLRRRRVVKIGGDAREGRQIHIDRNRPDGDEEAEQQRQTAGKGGLRHRGCLASFALTENPLHDRPEPRPPSVRGAKRRNNPEPAAGRPYTVADNLNRQPGNAPRLRQRKTRLRIAASADAGS